MSKKKDQALYAPVSDAQPFYHNSQELVESDLKHLLDEVYRVCKTHNLPFTALIEIRLAEEGTTFCQYKHYPEERYQAIGMTARPLLAHFLCTADSESIDRACELLIHNKLIQ